MPTEHTPTTIAALLAHNDLAVERAILAIYRRQTADEQQAATASRRNALGFSAAHAKRGTRFAKWVLSGRQLTGWHLEQAREIALHYTRQLADEATARAVEVDNPG